MTRVATVLVVVLMSAGVLAQGTPPAGGKPQPLDKAFAPLQGTWVINDIDGKAPPAMLLIFKGDKYEQQIGETINERGTIKLNATQKPTAIDLVIEEGDDAKKVQLGIVEVTGETMKLKLAMPAATTRPKSFNAEAGFLLVNLTKRK